MTRIGPFEHGHSTAIRLSSVLRRHVETQEPIIFALDTMSRVDSSAAAPGDHLELKGAER
jgi:hypothetical protein